MDKRTFVQFSEKEWYYGNLSENEKMQNGIGLKRECDGSFFYGFWRNGFREGLGVLCKPDGSLAAGSWEHDRSSEIILEIYPEGNAKAIFCGSFEKEKPEEGTLFCSDGKLYHGIFTEWHKGNFDGEGTILWPDKRIYAGHWKNGGTDIGGIIRRVDGRITGTLSNIRKGYAAKSWQEKEGKQFFYGCAKDEEVRNSEGIIFYADGEFYAGKMRGGQRTGFGVYRSVDGNIYVGDWSNSRLQGWGMCIRRTSDTIDFYAGEFIDGLYSGEGCRLCRTQDKWDFIYNGAWKDGKKFGDGILNLYSGKVYIGQFVEDQRDGMGETVASDGARNVMNWRKGKPEVLLEQVHGPGPLRDQYSKNEKIVQAMLNSLKDGDEFGEEQFFVGIRADANDSYQRTMRIEPGCDYEVRIFYHNNANVVSEDGTARETRLRVFFTKIAASGENGVVSASISSESNGILAIWDGITIQFAEKLSLSYKIASARLYNGWKRNGYVLPQTLFREEGVYLGTDELNGVLPPGNSGYVTFVIHASGKRSENSASFTSKKKNAANNVQQTQKADKGPVQALNQASDQMWDKSYLNEKVTKRRRSRMSIGITAVSESGEYGKLIKADIGEELYVRVNFTNSASDQDIMISVMLPSAVEFIKGSTIVQLSGGLKRKQSDDWLKDGLIFSKFAAEGEGEIQFTLRYLPVAISSHEDMKIKATLDTALVSMCGELQIIGK